MKKFLLFAAALVCAASVNAQVFQLDASVHGYGSDATDCEKGQIWGSPCSAVEFFNPFATTHKSVDCKNNNYNQVLFNGTDVILTKGGVQGQDNPKDIDGGNPGITLLKPVQGAVVGIKASADGYVYIVSKLSSNKNYYVFEEGDPIGFTLSMQVKNDNFPSGKISYVAEGEGEYNNIKDAKWTNWPEKVALGDSWTADIKVNGLGVIMFPVFEGCEYLVGAGGSKISWCGAYFSEAPVSVVLQGTDPDNPVEDFTLLTSDPNSINSIEATPASDAVSYNLFGQEANAATGLMIKNGNKVLVK